MNPLLLFSLLGALLVGTASQVSAQRPGPSGPGGGSGGPGGRKHTATESKPLNLVRADENPPAPSEVSIAEENGGIHIVSNGMPKHQVGDFPNRDNPNRMTEQDHDVVLPADPEVSDRITYMNSNGNGMGRLGPRVFGVTLDGVMMEPGTAETWMGRRDSGWNYEALGGAVPLGLDTNYAHVQPDGNYHYHGLPIELMKRLGYRSGNHSPMIGWAADGFPIYAMYGYSDPADPSSEVVELTTAYRLRQGTRPGGNAGPGGRFDGAFVQDYEFVAGSGDLDECNGRFCKTPEFPEGIYAYFLTREWPVIPRAFRGTPVELKMPDFGGERGGFPGDGPPQGRPPRFGPGGPDGRRPPR